MIILTHAPPGVVIGCLSCLVKTHTQRCTPVCPQWTAVASSLILTKHNVDCNTMALSSAYKPIILASADLANRASSSTGSFFFSCLKVI